MRVWSQDGKCATSDERFELFYTSCDAIQFSRVHRTCVMEPFVGKLPRIWVLVNYSSLESGWEVDATGR